MLSKIKGTVFYYSFYNMLELKTTEKCYRILELKLNLGQKKFWQILLRFYQTLQNTITTMYRSIYGFESVYLPEKGKIKKAFLFNIHMLHYDCCKGFLRP